jgi:hypothetical protein
MACGAIWEKRRRGGWEKNIENSPLLPNSLSPRSESNSFLSNLADAICFT